MSKVYENVQLVPPQGSDGTSESFESMPHHCGSCRGTGFFWINTINGQRKEPCKVCRGSGKMRAIVTVQWKPQ